MSDVRNVIIIGSGPAGYTAALYLARARLSPLMFAGAPWGGQLMLTTAVENYPGFEEGILGPQLMEKMRRQAEHFGTQIVDTNVIDVDFTAQPFRIWIDQGEGREEFQAKTAVITTGARAQMLGIGEERLLGRGVSTCAVCDAAFFKDRVTYVVGGGDSAVEEALALVNHARSVTLVHRRDTLRASKIMQERVLEQHRDRINVLWNTEVREVIGEGKLEAIVVEHTQTHERQRLAADGLFLAIGHIPATGFLRGKIELDEKGFLVTHLTSPKTQVAASTWLESYPTMTSVPGIFGAGDVVDFRYRQAVTAAGFGSMAALDAERYLMGEMKR